MKSIGSCILLVCAVLTACTDGAESVAGIDARGNPVVSKGSITGFGSVIVNGVRYETNSAAITVEGSPATQADLRVGDVVLVKGTLDDGNTTGVAEAISYSDLVEGPISAINVVAGTITVLEQIVVIDADTSFGDEISPASVEGLAVTDIVEVTGLFLADWSISATRIEKKPAGSEFEVSGFVSDLSGMTFKINNLVIDFSMAQLDDFPAGAPEDGQFVEAKGNSFGGNGELIATRVENVGIGLGGDDDDLHSIEGFITRFVSASDFDVEGITFTTDAATVFENGTAADLGLNRKVEAEGNVANGILLASKIEIKLSNFIRIAGIVEAKAGNTLTILGIQFNVDALTRYEDKSAQDVQMFGLDNIDVGDYLETRGFENASGIVATIVEREDFDGEVSVRGFVESVNDPDLTILGVLIQTDGGTVFEDDNDQVISASEFFGQAMGRLVDAKGAESNGAIVATEVELEN